MVQFRITVSMKPEDMAAIRQLGLTGPRHRVMMSNGPKAAASACQANRTRLNMAWGEKMARAMAARPMNNTTQRACLKLSFVAVFPSRISWLTLDAATSNWLSAVDIIADSMADTIMPASMEGNNNVARANKTCSPSPRADTRMRPHQPSKTMPVYIMMAQAMAISRAVGIAFLSSIAIKRLTTWGCPG